MIILHPADQTNPAASALEADPRLAPIFIAIASTDGLMVDAAFEEAEAFLIYETSRSGGEPVLVEQRHALMPDEPADGTLEAVRAEWALELLADVRCIVAADFGLPTRPLLDARGILGLDGERSVPQALKEAMGELGIPEAAAAPAGKHGCGSAKKSGCGKCCATRKKPHAHEHAGGGCGCGH